MPVILTLNKFIERSNIVHNYKYNYDLTNYDGYKNKVRIICPKHGVFEQSPSSHLSGSGCKECIKDKFTKSKSEFIKNSIEIHGNKYNYDNCIYINALTKISITCPNHGDFYQTPNKHLQGKGCPKCAGKYLDTKYFIEKSEKIHNLRYNYDLVDYKNSYSKVKIICKIHGIFIQTPHNHLNGNGCYKCGGTMLSNNEEFVKNSIKIHGDRYNYDNVNYINAKTPVIISCKKHGFFKQKPTYHLQGMGCQKCNISVGELNIMKILDDNKVNYISQYSFVDLIYLNQLHYDFAIFDDNKILKCLIEYNGIQHYIYNNFFHKTENGFESSKYRDKLKINYCRDNKIKLFTIKYTDDLKTHMTDIINFIKND